MNIHPFYMKDFYKVGHIHQYPKDMTLIFSNFTPRTHASIFFGLKYFIEEYLKNKLNDWFNYTNPENIYKSDMMKWLGSTADFSHINKLRDLGYWPIAIYALREGALVPKGVPAFVMYNTHSEFAWVPGILETIMSCILWGPCTSATIAYRYRNILDKYAQETSDNLSFVDYQAHDFSFRGMYGLEAAMLSGAAHLQYFKGTDTIPAILLQNDIYNRNIGCSVPATEHSVMSTYGKDNELETYRKLITEIYPSGVVSIVSDTWDLWNVVDNYLPILADDIMARNGTVVIRPDSGNPYDIIIGKLNERGLIERLWNIFGGKTNSKGYKELDPHIGAIYGDAIKLDTCESILEGLKQKGFASTNIIFGIGSYSYQYNTRDTFGWAMKSTYCEIKGFPRDIFKDPKTDNGTKRSHKGLLKVVKEEMHDYEVIQGTTWDKFHQEDNELKLVFRDGKVKKL